MKFNVTLFELINYNAGDWYQYDESAGGYYRLMMLSDDSLTIRSPTFNICNAPLNWVVC